MRKVLAFSLIFMLIGMSVIPSTGITVLKKSTAPTSNGNTLYVGGSGGGNYSKIQDAIDNASGGDTVYVYNGTYYENVVVGKTVNLIGEDKNTTIIDGGESGDVVYVSADWVNVSGFTIQHGGTYRSGISIRSDYNTISGNNISNNGHGIYLYDSDINTISGNTITDNNISWNSAGIYLYDSSYNTITGNTILNNSYDGINLKSSSYNNIIDNSFFLNGINISDSPLSGWNTHIIENNTLNDQPIRYYKNMNEVVVPSDTSQVILANCTNFTIQNLNLLDKGETITLGFSSYNTIIGNTILNNSYDGITFRSSSYNNIIGNNISNNKKNGIFLHHYSSNNNIVGNNISNNKGTGIKLYQISSYNNIVGNNISNNTWKGIRLYNSKHNNIVGNNISNNEYGIYNSFHDSSKGNNIVGNNISNNKYGLYLGVFYYNNISDNTITSNNEYGIYLDYSKFNTITGNTFSNNRGDGICLVDSSNNNIIYHNNFVNNTVNARDECSNIWDNGYPSGGNYWDDYIGTDVDSDGIGDTPYDIPGLGSNQDNYPLMYPWYPSHPDTVYVDDDYDISIPGFGYDKFNRIQYGINEVGGSTVYVFSGTYYENVVIDKTVNLVGEDRNTTIIDGSGVGDVVFISADQVKISDFKIKGSGASGTNGGLHIISDYNIIDGNILCYNNEDGIKLWQANHNILSNNNVISNGNDGIFINGINNTISNNYVYQSGDDGIDNIYSDENRIYENQIISSLDDGLVLYMSCNDNTIENNEIMNCDYGIKIWNINNDNNYIYHNNFINNSINAYDECNNTWDDGYPSGGNYWDDYPYDDYYHGPNQDIPGHDRIGDTPYNISGGSNQDLYPVVHPHGWLNNAPENITIDGPTSGRAGQLYTYTARADDPEVDPIYYKFDWGDGSYSDWLGPYFSGTEASDSHSWSVGSFDIKVKAKDTRGLESDWSEPLIITMPRNRAINNLFFRLFENHPNLFKLMQMLFQRLGLQ